MKTRSICIIGMAALLLSASSVSKVWAQSAKSQFNAESKIHLAQAQTQLTSARDRMISSLNIFLLNLQTSGLSTTAVDTLVNEALIFGSTIVQIWTDAGEAIAQDGTDALETLAAAAGPPGLGGHYPPDFLAGGRGAFDKAVATLEKSVVSAVKAVQTAAAKTEKAASSAGFGVTLKIFVPRERTFSVPQEKGQFADSGNNIPLDVYLVGGASRLDTDGDALIFGCGGSVESFVTSILFAGVSRDETGSTISDLVTVSPIPDVVPGFDGWKAILDGSFSGNGTGLREGNWNIRAGDPSLSLGVARLGIR